MIGKQKNQGKYGGLCCDSMQCKVIVLIDSDLPN
ncbi:hypothetical protein PAN31117_03324 [Pandoraea anapnoica]|uniref:Uncharacterized protein n=1 Tax=Pandoraea anapnoica TaxID=2508301 RepID=A0A5E5ABF3_9BURK|nr:hypothetical protein PAN31117_03324 [Pandoraea anapnoica]